MNLKSDFVLCAVVRGSPYFGQTSYFLLFIYLFIHLLQYWPDESS